MNAIQALYQLSYTPTACRPKRGASVKCFYYTENAAVWQANHRGFQKKFVPSPAGAVSPEVGEGERRLPKGEKAVKRSRKVKRPGRVVSGSWGMKTVAFPENSPDAALPSRNRLPDFPQVRNPQPGDEGPGLQGGSGCRRFLQERHGSGGFSKGKSWAEAALRPPAG